MPINTLVTFYNYGVKCKFNLCQSKRVNKSILLFIGAKQISENSPIYIKKKVITLLQQKPYTLLILYTMTAVTYQQRQL